MQSSGSSSGFSLEKHALAVVASVGAALFALHIYAAFFQGDYSFLDDYTYVSAAVHILLGQHCPLVAENSCNYEHPPLGKLFLALGFEIFGRTQTIGPLVGVGINQLGGRFFQILMNFLAAPVLFLVVKKLSANWKMALVAALLLAVDPLYYTLSLTAELDNFMFFFGLLALLPLVYAPELGKWKGYAAAGALFGLSLLSKENGAFFLLAALCYVLFVEAGAWRAKIRSVVIIVASGAAVFVVGLQIFDSLFTSFPSFLSHLSLISSFQLGFGAQQIPPLTNASCSLYAGLCPTDKSLVPHILYSGLPITPVLEQNCMACWTATNPVDWLTYFPPVLFPTALVLAVNYPLVWFCFGWVPAAVVSARRLRLSGGGKALLLALSVFGWNLGSNLWIFLALGRAVFEWYFLPAMPALAIGAAYIVTRPRVPRWFAIVLVGVLVGVALFLSPIVFHQLYPQSQVCTTC